MKKALLYRTLFWLLLMPGLIMASDNNTIKAKHSKEKKINKEFSVNADATIEIDNSYGNLDIVTWDQNRVVFEITITTTGKDEEKVQKKLDDITVEFEASSSRVSAKTRFNKNKSSSWWKWNKNSNVNMKINYIVKMPMTNNADLSNDYGSINLDKLEGRAIINCDYGKIITKELMAENNELNFDYTKNSYFEYINSGRINADYSGFTVDKSKQLSINADYTNTNIELAEDIDYNCDYGSVNIEKVNNVSGNGDYLSLRIGDVYKSTSVKADYGSIIVKNMTANANNVIIESSYVGITVGYDPEYAFDFEIDLEYASLRDHKGLEFNIQREESNERYYEGYHGRANSGNTMRITSDFGSVSLVKN